jgi:hypothetical protein
VRRPFGFLLPGAALGVALWRIWPRGIRFPRRRRSLGPGYPVERLRLGTMAVSVRVACDSNRALRALAAHAKRPASRSPRFREVPKLTRSIYRALYCATNARFALKPLLDRTWASDYVSRPETTVPDSARLLQGNPKSKTRNKFQMRRLQTLVMRSALRNWQLAVLVFKSFDHSNLFRISRFEFRI